MVQEAERSVGVLQNFRVTSDEEVPFIHDEACGGPYVSGPANCSLERQQQDANPAQSWGRGRRIGCQERERRLSASVKNRPRPVSLRRLGS